MACSWDGPKTPCFPRPSSTFSPPTASRRGLLPCQLKSIVSDRSWQMPFAACTTVWSQCRDRDGRLAQVALSVIDPEVLLLTGLRVRYMPAHARLRRRILRHGTP